MQFCIPPTAALLRLQHLDRKLLAVETIVKKLDVWRGSFHRVLIRACAFQDRFLPGKAMSVHVIREGIELPVECDMSTHSIADADDLCPFLKLRRSAKGIRGPAHDLQYQSINVDTPCQGHVVPRSALCLNIRENEAGEICARDCQGKTVLDRLSQNKIRALCLCLKNLRLERRLHLREGRRTAQ